jgi:hypothetical protein
VEIQTLFNVGASVGLAAMGWFARELWAAVKDLRASLSDLRVEIAKDYVPKADFKDAMKELRDLLVSIDNKLDKKADK